MESPAPTASVLRASALAGAAHLACDALTSRLPWTTPPYLLLDYAGEGFRDLLLLDRTTFLVAVAVISAGVNGLIAGLFATPLAGARHRVVAIGASLSALWVFSGGLMTLVYLSPPALVVAGSLLAGVPRAFAIAWILDRLVFRPADGAARAG